MNHQFDQFENVSNSQTELTDPPIASKSLSFLNRSGKQIAGFLDQLTGSDPTKGVIIIVPGYGKTKIGNLRLAYYLALNGFQVIRYDHSNHVGDSEGSVLFTTLSQMEEDLASVIDFVEEQERAMTIGIVGESLGARIALKRASKDKRLRFLVSLIGIFDLQETLRTIYDEDGFVEKLNGIELGIRDVMGFQVDADRFIEDAYKHGFHSIETSLKDVAELSIPTFFFVAEKDPWVSQEAARSVFEKSPADRKKLYIIPGIMHELFENPVVAADTCCEIVRVAGRCVNGALTAESPIQVPTNKVITTRTRSERRGSPKDLKTDEERIFWAKYLEKYAYIVNLQDYWNLLNSLAASLGDWKSGEMILDAGCGIGNFGTFILVRHLYQSLQLRAGSPGRKPLTYYVGVDFVDPAIQQAKSVQAEIYREFQPKIKWTNNSPSLVDFSYSLLDLNCPLPFKNNCFDKICCNLVLSYVRDPMFTLGELCRILKISGRIVISSLKPYADLSQIYRNYITVSRSAEEIEQARMVLSNAGMIRHKVAEGYYRFFPDSKLEALLQQGGCRTISTFRSLGDQANVAVGEKLAEG
jgi:alpha-beta hydrolase superfamily lysophospholipase/SAM-dependent methyltransferase